MLRRRKLRRGITGKGSHGESNYLVFPEMPLPATRVGAATWATCDDELQSIVQMTDVEKEPKSEERGKAPMVQCTQPGGKNNVKLKCGGDDGDAQGEARQAETMPSWPAGRTPSHPCAKRFPERPHNRNNGVLAPSAPICPIAAPCRTTPDALASRREIGGRHGLMAVARIDSGALAE